MITFPNLLIVLKPLVGEFDVTKKEPGIDQNDFFSYYRYAEDSLPPTMQGSGEKYMTACHDCPKKYPWLGNPEGSEDEAYLDPYELY